MRFPSFLAWVLLGAISAAVAQPTIDPAFLPSVIYRPAPIRAVLQQANGARVLAGDIRQASGQPANQLVRYLPSGTLDATFAANVAGYEWQPNLLAEAPGGKLLVRNGFTGVAPPAGSSASGHLVRLNADGTVDPTFILAPPLVSGSIFGLLLQPDGKVVVWGDFLVAGPASNPTPQPRFVLRLEANGSLDTGFVGVAGQPGRYVHTMALQPDGRLLLGGQFNSVHGQPRLGLARLLPNGTLDAGFREPGPLGPFSWVTGLAVQPDGKILIGGRTPFNNTSNLVRLDASGAYDPAFSGTTSDFIARMQVLPTGRILTQTEGGDLLRMEADGSPDASFQPLRDLFVYAWQVLPNGQVLVGSNSGFYPGPAHRLSALLLDADGRPNLTFGPRLQGPGGVFDMALQADGRIIIGGRFDEVNGVTMHGLARLNANGTLDATYAPQTVPNTGISTLALQADGKLLVSGWFATIGGAARPGLARLLPGGAADAGFVPVPNVPGGLSQVPPVFQVEPQANGQVLVMGLGYGYGIGVHRLLTSGLPDPSFQPPAGLQANTFAVQSDGRVVISGYYFPPGGNGSEYRLVRLLPDGALDPSFTLTPYVPASSFHLIGLALYPDGRLLMRFYGNYGSSTQQQFARLLPDGTVDATFNVNPISGLESVSTLCIQPNGRVLIGGSLLNAGSTLQGYSGSARLLPDGTLDAGYSPLSGPEERVSKFIIQADGKILAAGSFTTVSGLPIFGLTRLIDPNVLTVSPTARAAAFTAWPVPAREVLHVQLDAAARPQRVQLLDALGRAVLTQAATSAALTLPTAGLAPGGYVLRVEYAGGAATRRVVLE